jgi:hypothetical protein
MALAKGSQVALLGLSVIGNVLGGSAATAWIVFANGVIIPALLDADLAPDETVADVAGTNPAVGTYIFFADAKWLITAYVHRVGAAAQKIQVLERYVEGQPAFPYRAFVNVPA